MRKWSKGEQEEPMGELSLYWEIVLWEDLASFITLNLEKESLPLRLLLSFKTAFRISEVCFLGAKQILAFFPVSGFYKRIYLCVNRLLGGGRISPLIKKKNTGFILHPVSFSLSVSQLGNSSRDIFQDFSFILSILLLIACYHPRHQGKNQICFVVHPHDRLQNGNNI